MISEVMELYGRADRRQKAICILIAAAVAVAFMMLAMAAMQGTTYAGEGNFMSSSSDDTGSTSSGNTNLDSLTTAVTSTFSSIYTSIGAVLSAVAVVCLGICAFKWVLGSDPSSVRSAKTWMLNIIIGLAIFWLSDLIVSTVESMVSNVT